MPSLRGNRGTGVRGSVGGDAQEYLTKLSASQGTRGALTPIPPEGNLGQLMWRSVRGGPAAGAGGNGESAR